MKPIHKVAIVVLLAVAVVTTIALKNNDSTQSTESSNTDSTQKQPCQDGICPLPEFLSVNTEAGSPEVITKPLPKIVDLGAGKCIPCKMMAPILDELKETYSGQMEVVFIDVWKNPDAGKQYGINLIPTQIFYDAQGKELFRHEGFFGKEDILAKCTEFGFKLTAPAQTE